MDPTPEEAIRALRASAEGHLALGEEAVRPVRYVIDRRRGVLVFPLPADFADAAEAQLLVPGEQDPVLAALLSLVSAPSPPAEVELRFEIYHGQPREVSWAIGSVEAARYHGEAFDGEELDLADGLVEHEPELCRLLNADPSALRDACARFARANVERPVAVGVDPDGIDVRARFGIVRIEFDEPAATVELARERIAGLTSRSKA